MDRRAFLSLTAAVAAATASRSQAANKAAPVSLKKGDVVLFQGDSITDAGRDRKTMDQPNHGKALGNGYASVIAGGLLVDHRELGLKVYNRGNSGYKVPALQASWQRNTLDLKPALLSILVGVNDIWHKFTGKYDGTTETYREGYTALLKQTREALPYVALVVCEPFALRCGAVKDQWFPEFDERRAVAREVAAQAGAVWVPFHEMFADAIAAGTAPEFWAGDGVHPTVAGHALMAATWRRVVGV